jgi:hypothetical protein
MKIDRPAPATSAPRTGARPHAPAAAATRRDHSFHTSDDLRIDVVVEAFPDPDDPPEFEGPELDPAHAREAAHEISDWLAAHGLSIANAQSHRLQHLFVD